MGKIYKIYFILGIIYLPEDFVELEISDNN